VFTCLTGVAFTYFGIPIDTNNDLCSIVMTSPDFAAAQARVLARRAAAARSIPPPSPPSLPPALLNLPPGLRSLASTGLSTWTTLRHNTPQTPSPYFRVGQVDAELLDEELLQLLRGQVGDALKYFGGHIADEWSSEIGAILRAILWKLSIWDRGTSYGASLQGLKYVDARTHSSTIPSGSGQDPTKWQKAAYGLITVGGRYSWQKLEDWLLEKEGGYEEPAPLVRRLSKFTGWITMTHEMAALASFLVFLFNGKYRTLADRLLRLRLAPASAQTSRQVSFEYLNRQLVWHAFTEFLLFLLPLVGISRWRRLLSRAWKKVKSMFTQKADEEDANTGGELGFLPERTCAICYRDQNAVGGGSEAEVLAQSGNAGGGVIGSAQTDVTNPYEAIPCGCIYCFVCLAQRIEAEEGEGWTCLRCGEVVKECKPWNGDVLEDITEKPNQAISNSQSGLPRRKSVGFVDDEKEHEHEATIEELDPMPMEDREGQIQDMEDARTIDSSSWVDGESEPEDFEEEVNSD
jgi:peroxin-2